MVNTIKLPDPTEQFKKTPRMINKIMEWGDTVEVEAVMGEGENSRSDRYGDVYTRSEADPKANKAALPALLKHLRGKGRLGIGCPCCRGREFYWLDTDGAKWTPAPETGVPLGWRDNGDGSYRYTCRQTGEEVRLEP